MIRETEVHEAPYVGGGASGWLASLLADIQSELTDAEMDLLGLRVTVEFLPDYPKEEAA